MNQQDRTITAPDVPSILISDGVSWQMYTDGYVGSDGSPLPPIKQASYIARLRALADEIEKSELRS